jgi:hypothetical protein
MLNPIILKNLRSIRSAFILFLFIFTIANSYSATADESLSNFWAFKNDTEVYSESTYLSRFDDIVNDTRLRLHLLSYGDLFQSYVGVLVEQDTRSNEREAWNDNNVSPNLGVSSHPMSGVPLYFFAEYRELIRVAPRPSGYSPNEGDFRVGPYAYDLWELARISRRQGVFSEAYGEAIYSSRLGNNIFASAWSKTGLRNKLNAHLNFDAYVEGVMKRERSGGWIEENLQEVGPATRLIGAWGNIYSSLSLRRGFGSHLGGGGTYAAWTGLFVFAGSF